MASGLSFAYRCVERVFLWPTSVPMVYRGTFLLASQEQNVWRSVWKTTLYRLSVMPSFRPRIDTALAKV